MASFGVKQFRNRDNFAKYLLFYYETGTRVLLKTLRWLHQGSVEDFILKLPKNKWNGTESTTVEELKVDIIQLEDFDLSLLYKIIRLTDVFSDEDEVVWTKRCPKFRRVELMHLLFVLKTGRNNLAHPGVKEKNLTDLDVKTKSEEIKHLLTSIVEKAGERANVPPSEVNNLIKFVEKDVQRIYRDENTDSSLSPHVKNLIMNDLKPLEDDNSFANELKGYSMPYFQIQDDPQSSYHLDNILTICGDASVIVVTGDAGDGKSAMTRFLFNSWIEGKMDTVGNLSTFDIVLRVECRRIGSRDLSLFLEDHLPTASYSFLNTSSLKRHLFPIKVLWIMDGYDERTPEFDSFLEAILKELSPKHKIIITTRPNTLKDLQKLLSSMKVQTISLEKLREENIDEIMNNLIDNSNSRTVFKSELDLIDDAGKSLLRTPLNMTLYIELWLEDSRMAKGPYTTEILFLKSTYLQLNRLSSRLEGRTTLPTSEDLLMKIDQWFYGSLCKEAFFLAVQGINIINSKVINSLKKSANAYLVPSYCLSSFLVEEKGRNGTITYDFQHTTQITVLASMFLKNMEDYYPDINILKLFVDFRLYSTYALVAEIVQVYMKIIVEDNSINEDTDHIFYGLNKIISFFRYNEQCDLLLGSAIASKFDAAFMSLVSQTFGEIPFWAVEAVDSLSAVAKFLKFVKLKKIRLRVSNTFLPSEAQEFMELIEVLREKQIEVHIHTLFDSVDNVIGTSGIDKINKMSLNITAFTGSMTEFHLIGYHHQNLRSLELIITSEEDLLCLCKFLIENDSLYLFQVKIYVNCEDSYLNSPGILQFPGSFINVTTLVMVNLNKANFEKGVSFLSKLKGFNTSKFTSLHLPQENKFVDLFTESEDKTLKYFADEVKEDSNANCLGLLDDTYALQVAHKINHRNSNLDFNKILMNECTLVNDTMYTYVRGYQT